MFVQLMNHNGGILLLNVNDISGVEQAAPSSQWHGIRAIVRMTDRRVYEVSESITEVTNKIQGALSA